MAYYDALPAEIKQQIGEAYRAMVKKGHRAADPELTIEQEVDAYAKHWWAMENADKLFLDGVNCDMDTRKASIFALEAVRLMCAGAYGHPEARKLLEMAVEECKQYEKEHALNLRAINK
jgi:hypothetical protein